MHKSPGTKLRSKREALGETLDQAAAAIGCDASHLSRIERGLIETISVDLALRIRERFDIPVEAWKRSAA